MIILLVISLIAIQPSFRQGVVIKSVERNTTEFNEGLRAGQLISSINGKPITSLGDYSGIIEEEFAEEGEKSIDITTNAGVFGLTLKEVPKITVDNPGKTNIRTGLDLQGGARALIKPNATLSESEMNDLIQVSNQRFNAYGLSDVQIKSVSDLEGNRFMLIEVAGATPQDMEDLVSQQGKFEAKVSNKTVFEGGKKDITGVCRNDASCAGITQCSGDNNEGAFCNFQFTVYLSEAAAKRHANITGNLGYDDTGNYLSEKLYLYIDGQEVDSLLIGSSLRGQETTQISIQGSGQGRNQDEAIKDARASMKKLQTILITGSLPYKLEIVKLDTISPSLGEEFVSLILLAGVSSLVLVSIIIFIKYRKIKASIALLITSFSEIIIILGVASFIRWNLDLPSIAGILATIGTSVDSQIVILDEAARGQVISLAERIKRALFIIFAAYATAVASLIPLYWAGAGLFQGFAITTLIGITAGVFVSRPAFADMIRRVQE